MANLSTRIIGDSQALLGATSDWRALLGRSALPELTQHPAWALPWWEVFGESGKRSLRAVAFYDGHTMVGLAPLLARPFTYRPRIPFRRLELLASGEDEVDETCSDYLGLIAEKGREADVADAFAEALASGAAGPWDEIMLPAMNGESPLPAMLRDAFSARGLASTLEEKNTSPYVALPASWDAYLGMLKQSKRSQLKKALRALEQWAGGEPVIERVTSKEQIPEAARILEKLHKERWQSDGVYRSPKYRAFQERVMPSLLDIGALDLGWMSVRGEPVAAFYNLRFDGRVLHYQSGRKLDVPDDVRAGVTMHALLVKGAIADGMKEYDFLAGVSQYKMALSTGTRPLVTLRAARPSVVETARRAADRALDEAKRLRAYAKGEKETEMADDAKRASEPKKQAKVLRALDERTRPLFFGPRANEGRALFGWFHPAPKKGGKERAIVLCPALGYEGICAYPAMRELAERLAKAGYPVLRFDYDGTGDSGGLDSDPDRVRAWVASVGHAIDEVRALANVSEVCLFGVRIGATLALTAAAERGDVARVVAWNPCASGKAYARELRMFRLFAEQSGELAPRQAKEGDASEESGGFLFTEETLKALKALEPAKLDKKAANHVLVIGRDDVPDDDKLAKALEAKGATTTYQKLPGYAEMMVAPHKTVFPEAVYGALTAWLDTPPAPVKAAPANATSSATPRALVAEGVAEEVVRFGHGNGYFAVVTTPADEAKAKGKPLVVFSNTAGNYRIGPNRMYVEMGRKLAQLGIPSARLDVSGIGDSVIWDDEWSNHPYGDQLALDVRALIEHLGDRFERYGVAGLCSGAFVAYHAAANEPRVSSIVLINPQTFKWEDGMSLEVNPLTRRESTDYYKKRAFSKDAWVKLLKGGIKPAQLVTAAKMMQGRVVDTTRSAVAKAKAKLPGAASRGTDVARALDALLERGVDVLFVFAGNDPGIDNLDEKVGASMPALKKRPNFAIETIEGPDHSFTALWAQASLDEVLVGHLKRRFA